MSADSIIVECLKGKFITSSYRSIPQKVWKETLQRLFDAGIKTFPRVGNIERHFWNDIYPNLSDAPDVHQDTLDRLMYANFLQLKGVTVLMKAEGANNKIDDDIFPEAVEIAKYQLVDVFSLQRLNVLRNLSRNEYHINVDDPRLNLSIREKAGLLRSDEDGSSIEDNMNDDHISEPEAVSSEQADIEPVQASSNKSSRFVHFEEKGLSKVFTVSHGYNVVMVEKKGVKQFIAIPESQPLGSANDYCEKKDNGNLPPISKQIFDPPAASTQISPIKPIMPTFNSPDLHSDSSFNLLSMSQKSNFSKDMNQVELEKSGSDNQKPSSTQPSVIDELIPASQQPGTQTNHQSEPFVPPVHLNPEKMDVEPAANDTQQPKKTDSKMRRDIHRITQECRILYPMFFGKSTDTLDD